MTNSTSSSSISALPMTVGRSLLALYFLLPGLAKFAAFDMNLALMQHHNVPMAAPLLVVAGIANPVGAALLLSNRYVRFTSFGFVVYILLVNLLLHDFWNFSGIEAQHEMQNFIKNLGILAGTLILAAASPKRALWPLALRRSDASV
jgi:putative oxidoreductase